jgi:RNA polymerase sigma-70 factor (ECF subfamily)
LKPQAAVERSNQSMQRSASAAPDSAAERTLIADAAAGDERAFRTLVERHQDRAYGLAFRMLRSAADAEEVTQEAFVRAWSALGRFRGESSFGTWLHRIVARSALDRAVRLKRRRERETGMEALEQFASPGAHSPEAHAVSRRLARLMETLSPAQRGVVTLFYYEARPVEEIAELLGMPTGTVKTHLSRARAVLRGGWMKEEGAGS